MSFLWSRSSPAPRFIAPSPLVYMSFRGDLLSRQLGVQGTEEPGSVSNPGSSLVCYPCFPSGYGTKKATISSLPTKWAIRRAPQSHYPSPATLVVKALARDGLPQADQLCSSLGENLLDHLGGGRLDLLGHLLGSDRGGNALCLSHTLTYSFPAFS